MKTEEMILSEEQIERIFDRGLRMIESKWPDATCDHADEVKRLFIGRLMNRAEIAKRRRSQEANASAPDGVAAPKKTLTLEDFLPEYLEGESAPKPDRNMIGRDPNRPDSSEGMIQDWKDKLREEKKEEMEEELAEVFSVIDELANVNEDQINAVQTVAGDCVETDPEDGTEDIPDGIPDEALSAFQESSNLSDEENKLLWENDTGMLSWILYQLCQEILLDE